MTAWMYILTNKPNGVLYVGVTSEFKGRVAKHKNKNKNKIYPNSFSAQYNLDKLVYYEKTFLPLLNSKWVDCSTG